MFLKIEKVENNKYIERTVDVHKKTKRTKKVCCGPNKDKLRITELHNQTK